MFFIKRDNISVYMIYYIIDKNRNLQEDKNRERERTMEYHAPPCHQHLKLNLKLPNTSTSAPSNPQAAPTPNWENREWWRGIGYIHWYVG